jgi:hypothetical protein
LLLLLHLLLLKLLEDVFLGLLCQHDVRMPTALAGLVDQYLLVVNDFENEVLFARSRVE